MNDWNEDNFLERLAPHLRQEGRPGNGPLPRRRDAFGRNRGSGEQVGAERRK